MIPIERVSTCLNAGHFRYTRWLDVDADRTMLPVQAFVLVHNKTYVLSYRMGRFRPNADPLRGKRTIGFASFVFQSDLDLLFKSFFGIVASGINEIVLSLGLPRRLAEEARYANQMHPRFGSLIADNRTCIRFVRIVLSYRCPHDFSPTKNALSLNQLGWLRSRNPSNYLEDFDETSRTTIESGYLERILNDD